MTQYMIFVAFFVYFIGECVCDCRGGGGNRCAPQITLVTPMVVTLKCALNIAPLIIYVGKIYKCVIKVLKYVADFFRNSVLCVKF